MNLLEIAGPQSFLPAQREVVRKSIDALESALKEGCETGDMECPLHEGSTDEGNDECEHFFGDGVYVRSLWIPAGMVLVSRLHKQARVCLILSGRCRFVDEFQAQTVEAPWIGEFKAECKTAVFAETDTLWAACLGTDLKDPKTAVLTLTATSHRELLESKQ